VASGDIDRFLEQAATQGHFEYECRHVRKDGSLFLAGVAITALRDESGELSGFAKVTRDLTERSRAAEELKKAEAQLLQAQKMEAVGRLAGGVAHDFNNLLGVIVGYAELLRGQLPDGDAGRGRIERILDAAARAAALTRQLLAFSRRQILQPRVLDMNELVEGMLDMLRPLIGEDVELVAPRASGLGRVRADRGQIEQVVMNLVMNGAEATRTRGSGHVSVSIQPLEGGTAVALEVEDDGEGISDELLGRVFDPFFTTKEEGKGVGLGLAVVYGIVEGHGGQIDVRSALGKGTTFEVTLPLSAEVPSVDTHEGGAGE